MKDFWNKIVKSKWIIASFVIGLLISLFVKYGINNGDIEQADFNLNVGEQHINIKLKSNKELDYDTLLTKIFDDKSFMNGSVMNWLHKKDIYSIKDYELARRLANLNYEDDLSVKIRELSEKQKGPFEYRGAKIRFEKVGNGEIPQDYAYVCFNSSYANKKVNLSIGSITVPVMCVPKFDCLSANKAAIKLRKKDVKALLYGMNTEELSDSVWVRIVN